MPVHITEFRNDGSTPIVPGTTIVMPDHEANQKDEMPFLIYDWRPGYPPLCSIPGAVYRYQEAVTQMEEARYYDQPYTDWFDNACPPSLLIEQANDFVEQLVAKARGRSCFAFRNTQGLAPGTLWKD